MQNLTYVGSVSTITEGVQNLLVSRVKPFSDTQKELYSRNLIGPDKFYSKEEWFAFNSNKKKRLKAVHKKAQDLLNVYKQERLIQLTQKIFTGGSGNVKAQPSNLFKDTEVDPSFKCTLPLKALNITRNDIVDLWIENKVLPLNFREL